MIEQTVGDFKRQIVFKPGFDWRHANSSRDYGIGAVRMWFILIGEHGAVQWQIGTDWFTESARNHLSKFSKPNKLQPDGWDLGYHSKTPRYEGHDNMECDCLPEKRCYYDGSSLLADNLVEGFLNGGDEWVWNRLEAYYAHIFGDKEYPNFDPIVVPHPDERKALS